jgi:predicted nucleic acid-binding protein
MVLEILAQGTMLHASRHYREKHGLMANDSLIVSVMRRERITYLATNDAGFERIPEIAMRLPG